jgi:hypothetical protein
MDADTASFGTGRALGFQRTLGTGLFGKVDHAAGNKGHLLFSRTTDELPFPIQRKGLLVKAFALANGPGEALHLQLIAALPHQMATQIGPINVQFFQRNLLPINVHADRFGDTRFRDIGGGDTHGSDETRVQIMQHMALVPIHAHTPTFAPMTHLAIFDADTPIFGNALDETRFPLLIDLYILLLDLLRNL